jgi:predicted transcriptional regulator
MAVDIVSAYVGNNSIPTTQMPDIINTVYSSLSGLNGTGGAHAKELRPAVPIKKSITPDYVICLEDGKKFKMLKRHLRAVYGLSPEEYRAPSGACRQSTRWSRLTTPYSGLISQSRSGWDAKKGEKAGSRSRRP